MSNPFEDFNVKNPWSKLTKGVMAVAFTKAVKRHKLDLIDAKSFNLANYGPHNMSLESVAKVIEANGFDIEITVKLKRK